MHKDHLGSVVATLSDRDGNIVERTHYDAWGKKLNLAWTTEKRTDVTLKGFTGHQELSDFGLIHMGGRIYDPTIARFLNPDPFVQEQKNIQNFNKYSYVLNNPYGFTDPTGYFFNSVGNWFKNAGNTAGNWLSGAASSVGNWFETAASDAGKWIVGAGKSAGNWLKGAAASAGEWFKNAGIAIFENTFGNEDFVRGLTIAGAVIQIGLGIAIMASLGWTGVGAVMGAFLVLNGIDTVVWLLFRLRFDSLSRTLEVQFSQTRS